MKGIILLAHGSRDPQWTASFEQVRAAVERRRPECATALAYLEQSVPDFATAVDQLVARGTTLDRSRSLVSGCRWPRAKRCSALGRTRSGAAYTSAFFNEAFYWRRPSGARCDRRLRGGEACSIKLDSRIYMPSMSLQATPRSMLFVSGEKAERFPKAMVAGADVVCIDLEDAVHIERKQAAREQVLGWLSKKQASEGPAIALRINGLRTLEGLRDVLALDESGVHIDWLLVPKVEDAADLRALHSWIGQRYDRLTALIETPRGVENALSIAHAGGKLAALMLGGADLAAELGAQFGWDGIAARPRPAGQRGKSRWTAGVGCAAYRSEAARRSGEETRRVLALGFSCKTAIHPQQIPIIHAAFAPSPDELAWAKALLQAIPDGPMRRRIHL